MVSKHNNQFYVAMGGGGGGGRQDGHCIEVGCIEVGRFPEWSLIEVLL